jgi:hypothetical protein
MLLYPKAITYSGFVEWYIDQHAKSEREMRPMTEDERYYLYARSAAEVFNVEIVVCK